MFVMFLFSFLFLSFSFRRNFLLRLHYFEFCKGGYDVKISPFYVIQKDSEIFWKRTKFIIFYLKWRYFAKYKNKYLFFNFLDKKFKINTKNTLKYCQKSKKTSFNTNYIHILLYIYSCIVMFLFSFLFLSFSFRRNFLLRLHYFEFCKGGHDVKISPFYKTRKD